MQMKTAMQELIQSLKAERMIASNEWQMGYQKALSNVILEIESMLENEKEIMCQFQEDGQSTDFWVKYDDWEDCFDKTFNTNKQ
jgi:hypothetical protein